MAKLYQMTRNNKIVELLFFKGKIGDRRMHIDFLNEQEKEVGFKIVVSIIKI